MAKKTHSAAELQDALNQIAVRGESEIGLTYEQIIDLLEQMPEKELVNLNAEYWKPQQIGEVLGVVVTGFTVSKIDGKDVEMVTFTDKSGKQYVAAQTVVVSACKKLKQLPQFVKLVYNGMKGTRPNEYADISVLTFQP